MPLMRAPFRLLTLVVAVLAVLAVTTAAPAAAAVSRPDAATTGCSLVGTWTRSVSWTSGPLAGASGSVKVTFRTDGSFAFDTEGVHPDDRWTPTTMVDINNSSPGERTDATFTADEDCVRAVGTISYTGGGAEGSAGSLVLTRGWCSALSTVDRSFRGSRDGIPIPRLFTVQFTRLSVCWDGAYVWFKDSPEFRLYVDGTFTSTLVGACAGNTRSATDPTNANKLTSIYITCQAVFSNKQYRPFYASPDTATDGGGDFEIPAYLNAGLAFPQGFVATPPPADQYRYYTIQILSDGCHTVSGIADNSRHCL